MRKKPAGPRTTLQNIPAVLAFTYVVFLPLSVYTSLQSCAVNSSFQVPSPNDSSAQSPVEVSRSSIYHQRPRLLLGPRTAPSFQNGGVMIFFHVAKNGGTSIRNMLKSYPNVNVRFRTNFGPELPLMKKYVEGYGVSNVTLVVEIHYGNDPNLPEMATAIHNLRRRAADNGVPFFVFSTYREPLAYAVSFYNFENMGQLKKYEHGGPNEHDFMRLSLPSPQCLFFARGELATTVDFKYFGQNLTMDECLKTYEIMTETVDWIGTVERMQTDTLPLLTTMLEGSPQTGRDHPVQNRGRPKIQEDKLSNTAIQHIRDITKADYEIYQRVQRDYPFSMWTNLKMNVATNEMN